MLGYPLKTLLKALESRHGRAAVVQTLEEAGLPPDRAYRLNETYADALRISQREVAVALAGRDAARR